MPRLWLSEGFGVGAGLDKCQVHRRGRSRINAPDRAGVRKGELAYARVMSLKDDALRLVELDQQVVRAIVEGNTEELFAALGAYMELRKSLKTRLLDESTASVANAEAAEVLRKISGGEGLPSDKIIERLAAHSGEDISAGDFDDAEIEELGSKFFYSWYSHHEYIAALAELRPLILRSVAPESVTRLVRQVKNCYAFQQYDAAYGSC